MSDNQSRAGSKSQSSASKKEDPNHLLFIRLLTELSEAFIKISAGDIGVRVEALLRQIGELVGFERTDFIQRHQLTGRYEITHSWNAKGIESYPHIMTDEQFPWLTDKIKTSDEYTLFHDVKDLPREAEQDKESLKRFGIKAMLLIPYSAAGTFLGTFAFGKQKNEESWTEMQLQQMRLLGEVLSNAKRSKDVTSNLQQKQEEIRQFNRLLVELSSSFINLPSDEIDVSSEAIMRYICGMLRIERAIFWQPTDTLDDFEASSSWSVEGVEPLPKATAREAYPWMIERVQEVNKYFFFSVDQLPAEAEIDKKSYEAVGVKYGLLIPYLVDGEFFGTMAFTITTSSDLELFKANFEQLRLLGEVIVNALRRKATDQRLKKAFTEIKNLKDQLQKENISLREEIEAIHRPEEIIGESEAIYQVLKSVEEVAGTDANVLILGETGTGKELVARAIHNQSRRKSRTMVTVNCAALSPTLVESELFGREKGAYTGAMTKQVGRFETADGSTLFLDEIGELPLELQVKLLRVLQEGQFERLGSPQTIKVDVRLVAATNRNLEKAVLEGTFREDLYYRLNVFPINVQPLRERQEDVLPLIWHYAKELGKKMGKQFTMIPRKNLEEIRRYSWPGNIRELRNLVERAVITSKGKSLQLDVPRATKSAPRHLVSLEEYERLYILEVLEKTRWRISGESGAAAILGVKPTTLHSRMKKLEIRRNDK